jgi:Ran GTPase-activating protein (RanGAP) involved in mRNA processing and transport
MSTSVQIKPQDVNISATTQLEVSNAAVEMASNLISTESLVQVNFGDQYHGCKLLVVLQSLYFLHTATVFFSQI